jgi:hypothetical protein
MKPLKLSVFISCLMGGMLHAQTNSYPATGNIPLNMPANTAANFNLQLHGNADYMISVSGVPGYYDLNGTWIPPQAGYNQNHGVTSRFGMTNTLSGLTSSDGMLFRMSEYDFVMENLEKKDIDLITDGLSFKLSGTTRRAWFGGPASSSADFATLNFNTTDNGIYIRTLLGSKYGLSVRSNALADEAIRVTGTSVATSNFCVKASGQTVINYPVASNTDKVLVISNTSRKLLQLTNDGILKTREVNVDLAAWADYVFKPNYRLMPLKDVNSFIKANGHLPNVPSAATVETEGLNVGDMTKVLMEKVEELTLYIIEQQSQLEKQQAELSTLKAELKNSGTN